MIFHSPFLAICALLCETGSAFGDGFETNRNKPTLAKIKIKVK
jgi:hypothetical protein